MKFSTVEKATIATLQVELGRQLVDMVEAEQRRDAATADVHRIFKRVDELKTELWRFGAYRPKSEPVTFEG